jgi:hypothetical protein
MREKSRATFFGREHRSEPNFAGKIGLYFPSAGLFCMTNKSASLPNE